jgi:hypothetical protein
VNELLTSPDGNRLALLTNPISKREEKFDDYEIYLVDVDSAENRQPSSNQEHTVRARRITQNKAVEKDLHWGNDSRHLFFTIEVGDVSGPYRDLQPHLYSMDVELGTVEQWGTEFTGPVDHYAVAADEIFASARTRTEVQL